MLTSQDIIDLPKAQLHIHLFGGCPRPLWNSISTSNPVWHVRHTNDGLSQFDKFYGELRRTIVQNIPLDQLVKAMAEQAMGEGCRWVELSVDLSVMPDHEAFLRMVRDMSERVGLAMGVISLMRGDQLVQQLRRTIAKAQASSELGVVGIGMAGPELPNRLHALYNALQREKTNLLIVPHAGEVSGALDVEMALRLKPHRIAHGVQSVGNENLMHRISQLPVCLDLGLSANEHMGSVQSTHPLLSFIERGVKCSLNTDDPLLFDTDLVKEYLKAMRLGLSVTQVAQCARWSFIYSAAPTDIKEQALRDISAWEDNHNQD